MLTQTKTEIQQVPVNNLKVCVNRLNEEEIRIAISYMVITRKDKKDKDKDNQQTLVITSPSPRLAEMIFLIDGMSNESRDKLSLFLLKQIAPKLPSKYRIREGKGKINR